MLVKVSRGLEAQVLARWRGGSGRRFVLTGFLRQDESGNAPSRLYTDSLESPRLIVAGKGARVSIHGPRQVVRRLMRSLLDGPRSTIPGWPDHAARQVWQASTSGRPYLFLSGSYATFRDEMARTGFIPDQQDLAQRQPHYMYWVSGKPRFTSHVKHSCRLGIGQELHSLLLTGIHYDETGEYTKQCLEAGPSVVVEIVQRGKIVPVSWSCTHLSGAIGMIYTPEKHRGHGYGSSLTAFHVDLMLRLHGQAFAQVRWNNLPSQRMFDKLGARRTHEPLGGAAFYWPDGKGPK